VARPRRLALMNLLLHAVEPHIKLGDTIYEPVPLLFMRHQLAAERRPEAGLESADVQWHARRRRRS
jgi:hypothetical protein